MSKTKTDIEILPAEDRDTEALLRGMILEVHAILRDQVRPAIRDGADANEQRSFLSAAVSLVQIAAVVGDTIGRLRFGSAIEMRQRITVERVAAIPPGKEGG